jgi:hypothetical protein
MLNFGFREKIEDFPSPRRLVSAKSSKHSSTKLIRNAPLVGTSILNEKTSLYPLPQIEPQPEDLFVGGAGSTQPVAARLGDA